MRNLAFEEVRALTYRSSDASFMWAQSGTPRKLFSVTPTGTATLIGTFTGSFKAKGLAFLAQPPFVEPSLGWTSRTQLTWNAVVCAETYNVYRATYTTLPDANDDALSEDYGTCLDPALTATETTDTSDPPAGQLHHYLVTAANEFGEGSLGTNGGHVERQDYTPCF